MKDRGDIGQIFAEFCKTGDPETLARVFDAAAQKLLLVAVHLTRDDSLSQDLVQATFIKAVEGAAEYDDGRPFMPWITGILVHEAKMELRRRGRRPDPDRLPDRNEPGPDEAAVLDELNTIVAKTVGGMPEPYRRVLTLRLVHGLKNVEIAHALGVPAETVRTQVRRGLEQLRKLLPAGLAGTVMLLTADAGLAATRSAVLERATRALPPTVAGTGGSFAVKKLFLGAVGFLTLLLGYAVLTASGQDHPAAPEPIVATEVDADSVPGQRLGIELPISTPPRTALAEERWLLTGRVTDRSGDAVPNAVVWAAAEWGDLVEPFPEAFSDADGAYEIDLDAMREIGILRRTMARITATATASGLVPVAQRDFVALPESAEGAHDFRLDLVVTSGAWIRGSVLSPDLTPIEGARVYAQRQAAERTRPSRATTGSDGRYEIAVDVPGNYLVESVADRHGAARTELGRVTMGSDVHAPELVLEPHHVLEGRLVMEDGSPFSLMQINLFHTELEHVSSYGPPQSADPLRKLYTLTDSDGWFRAAVVEQGEYRLEVRQARGGAQELKIETDAQPQVHVVRGQHFVLRVVDANGHALPGSSYSYDGWLADEAGSLEEIRLALREDLYPGKGGAGDLSDANGEKRFLLPLGSTFLFDVVASDDGLNTRRSWTVERGLYHAEMELVLRPMDFVGPLANLHISVQDDAGQRQDAFDVRVRSTMLSGHLDSLGLYDSTDLAGMNSIALPAGEYRLFVQSGRKTLGLRENFVVSTVFALGKGEERTVSLTARRGGFLRLSLQAPPGDDVLLFGGLEVETDVSDQPKTLISTFRIETGSGYAGTFMIPVEAPVLCRELFAPGSHRLTVSAHGFRPVQVSAVIRPGEVTDVEVAMKRL